MKYIYSLLILTLCCVNQLVAQDRPSNSRPPMPQMVNHSDTLAGKEMLSLSTSMWQWMADKDADKLANLYHDSAVFVHMGGCLE